MDIVQLLKELTGIGLPPSLIPVIWVYWKLDKRLTHIEYSLDAKLERRISNQNEA